MSKNNHQLTKGNFSGSLLPTLMPFNCSDVKLLRESLGTSQPIFGQLLNVTTETVRKWESNPKLKVSGSTLVLMNQLKRKGLSRYLSGENAAPDGREDFVKAAYKVVGAATENSKAYTVPKDVMEALRAQLGVRNVNNAHKDSLDRAIVTTLSSYAEKLSVILNTSVDIGEARSSAEELLITTISSHSN
ncbi:MAG: hypothetical protein HAW67_03415 [Endozoicomonadaceae bacterium]|nr:hypothetical protein [Endozoicomonadaceae bacterium]